MPVLSNCTGRLAGRRIAVTGAGSGMGKAVARLFAQEGARVALLDRDATAAEAAAAQIGMFALACDVGSEADVERAFTRAADRMGGVDGVVHAASIIERKGFAEITIESWTRIVTVNLTGTFLVCRSALPHLEAAGSATIVNFSSGSILQPVAEVAAYIASKAGVAALSKALAVELGPKGIRVNAICPGHIDTPMIRNPDPMVHAQSMKARSKQVAMGRVGYADEVAALALFLTCAESSYVNGSVISIDGGRAYH